MNKSVDKTCLRQWKSDFRQDSVDNDEKAINEKQAAAERIDSVGLPPVCDITETFLDNWRVPMLE